MTTTPNLDAVLAWWRGGDLSAPINAPLLDEDPDRPFLGRNWTAGRMVAYSIASASSGCVAQLPPRPAPTPTRVKREPTPKTKRGKKR